MKVRFDFSLADLADVAERTSGRSKTVHAWRREARMLWAALISLALFFAIEGDIVARALYAALAFVGLLALYPLVFRGSPKGRYIEYYREQLGSDGPFQCEVEITSEGVTVEQNGAQLKRPWSSVKEVADTSGAIEFVWNSGGSLVVRDRPLKALSSVASSYGCRAASRVRKSLRDLETRSETPAA